MPPDEPTGDWYVRSRGRVLGPLTWPQLQSLRDSGRLARFDEVSQDRRTWTAAGQVPHLFPQLGEPLRPRASSAFRSAARPSPTTGEEAEFILLADEDDAVPASTRAGTVIEDDTEWYFARDRTQQGPVRFWELRRLIDTGEIGPSTLVWRAGFDEWIPASHVEELRRSFRQDPSEPPQDDPATGVMLPPRQSGNPINPTDPPPHRTSILAINSVVMGCFWLFGLGSLVAIVLGATALRQIARSQRTLTGHRLAIAGILIGIAGLGLTLFIVLRPGFFSGSAP